MCSVLNRKFSLIRPILVQLRQIWDNGFDIPRQAAACALIRTNLCVLGLAVVVALMHSESFVISVDNKPVFCIIRFEQVDERFVPIGPAQTHWKRRHLSKSRCTRCRAAGHAVRQTMEPRETEAKTARSARHIQVILDANCCAQRRLRGCGHYIQVNAVAFFLPGEIHKTTIQHMKNMQKSPRRLNCLVKRVNNKQFFECVIRLQSITVTLPGQLSHIFQSARFVNGGKTQCFLWRCCADIIHGDTIGVY